MQNADPVMTRKNAQSPPCALLRTRLRLALTSAIPGKLDFITRPAVELQRKREQAAHIEQQVARFVELVTQVTTLAKAQLEAAKKKPSQRRVAEIIGLPESTFRYCKKHPREALSHFARFRQALQKLQPD